MWANDQRSAGEDVDGAADGIVEQIGKPGASGVTLTGNAAWKTRLQAGETVEFRGKGNSLHPRIKSGECCRYEPAFKHDDIKEKDIVFVRSRADFGDTWSRKKPLLVG